MPSPSPKTTDTVRCEVCGSPMEFIPYQDQAGCGSAILELWRCPNGHARYGDIIGYAACDVSPTDSDNE